MTNIKKILIIDTGGTISQEKSENGSLIPGVADIVKIVPRLKEIANIEYELITRVDSTDITQEIRAEIVNVIEKKHKIFDGFVITHGTDTMADTACALNYMVQNLGKPIVITGAQLPMFAPGPDGLNNLFYSVKAATDDLGEVVICFGDRIIRGNRSYKNNVEGFNAFDSPRAPFVGNLGVNIKLNENRIKRFNGNPKFFKKYETGVVAFTQVSGGNCNILEYCINDSSIKGIVIQGYGTGNIQKRFIKTIKKLTDAGKKVVIVTSCAKGSTILEQYKTGYDAKIAGALSGRDLSIHAATQKMIYALGLIDKTHSFEDIFYETIGRDFS
ncbi:MAG: asparaginase [Spirochaetaceae bacterium]